MAGLYQTLKTWNSNDVLYALDIDAEFQNVKNNMIATSVEGYSSINNVFSQNRAVAEINPAPGGVYADCVDNQTVAGEIEKLRFVVHRIIDGGLSATTYAQTPIKSLAAGSQSNIAWNLPFYGPTQAHAFQNIVKKGAIANALSRSALDFSVPTVNTSASKFTGQLGMTLGAANILAYPGNYNLPDEGTLGVQFNEINAGDFLFYNPLLGVQFSVGATSKLILSQRLSTASGNTGKNYTTISGATSVAGQSTWNQAMLSYKFNNGSSLDNVAMYLNGAIDGSSNPSTGAALAVNGDAGGVWFIGSKPNDPTWLTFEAMNVTPDIASGLSGGATWAATGTATSAGVSNGILSVNTIGTSGYSYITTSASVGINPASMTVDFKLRILETQSSVDGDASSFCYYVSNGTIGFQVNITNNYIVVASQNGSFGSTSDMLKVYLNTNAWHIYRLTMNGSAPVLTLYIDGVNVGSYTNTSTNSDTRKMLFGSYNSGYSLTTGQVSFQMEWFAFSDTVTPPVVGSSTNGVLADIFSSIYQISDAPTLTAIGSSTAGNAVSILGKEPTNGLSLPNGVDFYTYYGTNFDNNHYVVSDGASPVMLNSALVVTGTSGTVGSQLYSFAPVAPTGSTTATGCATLLFNGNVFAGSSLGFYPLCASQRVVFPQGINAVAWAPGSGNTMKYSVGRG